MDQMITSKSLRCPTCGESNCKMISDNTYVCNICSTTFFKTPKTEFKKLEEAQNALSFFEFEKADELYQTILENTHDEKIKVMAYLGRLLASFGVCYIKDYDDRFVVTFTNYDPNITSIKESRFYNLIIGSSYKDLYFKQLEELDYEYKKIKEELLKKLDFDVFICSKVSTKTTSNKNAIGYTIDSKFASTVYDELVKRGFKVFYSEKSLSGIKYDAQIYTSLMRSKSFLLIGSELDYLESPWVKSEWRRWLNLIEKEVKGRNSLFLYTPKENVTLPVSLSKTQKFTDGLSVVNAIEDYVLDFSIHNGAVVKKLKEAANLIIYNKFEEAEAIYQNICNSNNDYRAWLGLIDVLLKTNVPFTDERYLTYYNQAMNNCDSSKQSLIKKNYGNFYKQSIENKTKQLNLEPSKGLQFRLSNDETYYQVQGIGYCSDHEVVIPDVYLDLPVKKIERRAFYGYKTIIKIYIPDSITIIENEAFKDCSNLEVVRLSNSIEEINFQTFYGCTNLLKIEIPSSVKTIKKEAFGRCKSIKHLEIPKTVSSIELGAFSDTISLESIVIPFVGESYESNFQHFETNHHFGFIFGAINYKKNNDVLPHKLTSVRVSNGGRIKQRAFYGCKNLKNVVIENVIEIEEYVFYNLSKLESITLPFVGRNMASKHNFFGYVFGASSSYKNSDYVPNSLSRVIITDGTILGEKAFFGCGNIKELHLPSSIIKIENKAICGVNRLTHLTIPVVPSEVGEFSLDHIFGKPATDKVKTIKDTLIELNIVGGESIPNNTFENFKLLKSVYIGNSIKEISKDVFKNCLNIKELNIEDLSSWMKIKFENIYSNPLFYSKNIFIKNEPIKNIEVPKDINEILDYTFINFESLENINFNDLIAKIGKYAFSNCSNILRLDLPKCCNLIEEKAFMNCSKLKEVILPKMIKNVSNGLFSNNINLSNVILYDMVETIEENAFSNCVYLEKIDLPNSLKKIKDYAFSDCIKLKNLIIPSSVEIIEKNAFKKVEEIYCLHESYNFKTKINTSVFIYKETKPKTSEKLFRKYKYWHYENGLITKW